MTVPDLYPAATFEPVSYIGEAGTLADPPAGWVLHVQAGNGDPHAMFEAAKPPNRRFSHLWVAKDGRVRQYQRLTRASWAQGAGNSSWWSVETEGLPLEPLTDAQLDALAAWHVWSWAEDTLAVTPLGHGIGTHGMGGDAWGAHPGCPGTVRAGQRAEILRRAALLRGGTLSTVDLTRAALNGIADILFAGTTPGAKYKVHDPENPDALLGFTEAMTRSLAYQRQIIANQAELLRHVQAIEATLTPKP